MVAFPFVISAAAVPLTHTQPFTTTWSNCRPQERRLCHPVFILSGVGRQVAKVANLYDS